MTDKVQKIREEVERLKRWNNNVRYSTRHMTLQEEDFNRGKHSSYLEILNFIDSLQEEPANEDFEKEMDSYLPTVFSKDMDGGEPRFTTWFMALRKTARHFAQWQKEHLWKPADGDDLPEYEHEVVVFTQDFPNDAGIMKVAIAHRPNPKGFDGKSLLTGKVEHYTPMAYGQGRWNIPDVKYWLDVELPKEIEL